MLTEIENSRHSSAGQDKKGCGDVPVCSGGDGCGIGQDFRELGPSRIADSYARLRLVRPEAERRMVESMRRYGQLTPVVVLADKADAYELVDGFKRLKAARDLGLGSVTARVIQASPRVAKASMIQLNRTGGFITDLEEAMVCRSLHREDGLNQVEIATLLGRDKSWVSRRISLIERLCDQVLYHIRLGLVPMTTGRELARLPRGNQPEVIEAILKHRLGSRESGKLISLFLERPRWEREGILRSPWEALEATRAYSGRGSKQLGSAASRIYDRLCVLNKTLDKGLLEDPVFTQQESRHLLSAVVQAQTLLTELRNRIE